MATSTSRDGSGGTHIVDRILPNVPVRQWVLLLPFELRGLAASKPDVLTALCRIFSDEVLAHYRCTAAVSTRCESGAVSHVQRFGQCPRNAWSQASRQPRSDASSLRRDVEVARLVPLRSFAREIMDDDDFVRSRGIGPSDVLLLGTFSATAETMRARLLVALGIITLAACSNDPTSAMGDAEISRVAGGGTSAGAETGGTTGTNGDAGGASGSSNAGMPGETVGGRSGVSGSSSWGGAGGGPTCPMFGAKRCNGNVVELCGAGWSASTACPFLCVDGACAGECRPDAERCVEGESQACDSTAAWVPKGMACVPPPRPIAPMSTARSTTRRPTFRWELPSGVDGARVEICKDRACTQIIVTFDAMAASAQPTEPLPSGTVFWRLRGISGDQAGEISSAVWQVRVSSCSAEADTSWGTTLDLNGDGHSDVAFTSSHLLGYGSREVHVHEGSASGLQVEPWVTLLVPPPGVTGFADAVHGAGDVNGDGYADMLVSNASSAAGSGVGYVYLGGPQGLASAPSIVVHGVDSLGAAGDINGDGYADILALADAYGSGRIDVYGGRPDGLPTAPDVSLYPSAGDFFGDSAPAGDLDADGYADFAINGLTAMGGVAIPQVHVYRGASTFSSLAHVSTLAGASDSGLRATGAAPDVDGDGHADLVLGTRPVRVHLGTSTGIAESPALVLGAPDGSPNFGDAVTTGDLDGDCRDDLVVGANDPGAPSSNTSYVDIFFNGIGGLPTTPSRTMAGPSGAEQVGGFGFAVAAGGDIDGDGYVDLVVGAPDASTVFVFAGGAMGPSSSADRMISAPAGTELGVSIAE